MRAPLDFLGATRAAPRTASETPDAAALSARALELRRAGDHKGAARALEQAEALAPSDRSIALNLAACLLKAGEPEAACARFRKVLDAEPGHAEARYGLGVALKVLGRRAEARQELERTIELAPSHAPALGALAFALYEAGETGPARAMAERAVAAAPGWPDATMVLAKLDAAEHDWAALKARAQALIARRDLGPDNRATAWLLLGDALDGEGDHGRAFEAYRAGKALFRQRYAPAFQAPGARSALDVAEAAAASLAAGAAAPRPRPAEPAADAPDAKAPRRHVFLLGFARSGTTLLEQVLGAHPEVIDLEEMSTLAQVQRAFVEAPDGLARLAELDDAGWTAARRDYWARVRRFGLDPAGKVFVDKQPLATLMLPAISALFPEAKVLFAVRDPRDVVLSCFRRGFKMNPAMYEFTDLDRAARFYDATMRTGMLARERLPLKVHDVRYEQFVADFEAETRAACAFLGLDWSEEMAGFAERARARKIKTPSAAQVARGLYTGGVGQWRNYREALAPVLPRLEPWVKRFGYPAD